MTIDAKLRITAETAQAVGKVRELLKTIEAVNKGGAGGAGGALNLVPGLDQAGRKLGELRGQVGELRGLMGQVFAVASITAGLQALTRASDTYQGLTARLRLATAGQVEYNKALGAARALSNDYQQGLEGVARLVTKTFTAIKPLGGTLKDATSTTEALLAALKADGAAAQEAASAVLQFSQALSSGVLRGEEFNAISEAAPSLLAALAKGLGKPRSELKALGEQGKLTTDQIVIGLTRVLPELRATAAAIPPTIGGGFTQLNNAITEFLGKGAQTSGTARLIADTLKLAADNAGLLVGAVGALAGAALLGGLGRLAGALGTVVLASGGVGAGLTGLLALIGGPAGLVVVLGSLAAAWLVLRNAKQKSAESDLDALRSERDAVRQELAAARASIGQRAFGTNFAALNDLDAQAKALDARIERITEQQREQAKFARQAKADDAPNLRDPAGLKKLADEYKLTGEISKKFEDDRKQLIKSTELEIGFLRKEGRDKEADALQVATDARLKVIDKAERDALRKNAPVASRVAAFKQAFSASLELQRDAIEREKAVNQQAFDDGLRDLKTYLGERSILEETAFAADTQKLQDELAQRRRALAQNENRVRLANNPNERESASDAVFQQRQDIERIEADIAKRKRDQAASAAAVLRDTRLLTEELARQQAEIGRDLAKAQGQDLSPEQLRAEVLERFKPQLERLKQLGGDTAPLLKLVDVETTRAQLEQIEREYTRVSQQLALREAEVTQQLNAGKLTSAEAEAQTLALRREQIPVLDEILARMQALAVTPEDKQRLEQLRLQVGGLKDLRTELETTARSAGVSAISQGLTDIATGAKTAKEGLLDMIGSFARSMLDVLSKRLAEKLVGQFLDAVGGTGDGGGGGFAEIAKTIFSSLFHTGGVVGGLGGTGRMVNPAAFALAPRYHAGGLAGFAPDEVPAVLRRGEEVLTAQDPRHRNNGGRAGGINVQSHIEINGAGGTDPELQRAGDDLQSRMRATVDQWAADNSRPGGVLFSLRGA